MLLFEGDLRANKLTPGEMIFLDTLAQRCYTPFLSGLSTTCGVILIREAQYIDYVVFNDPMKRGEKDGRK